VLIWTSTLDTFWNDLARQPVFLPFVHQLVKYAASYAEANPWHIVGEVLDVDRYFAMSRNRQAAEGAPTETGETIRRDFDWVVTSPSSKKIILSRTEEKALLPLEEQGFYQIRRGGVAAEALSSSVAVNLDTGESDLSRLDPQELVAAVTFREAGAPGTSAAEASDMTPEAQESRQAYWWFLLFGALLFLATETFLSNRLSMSAR
jgi:hypothetical protein